MEESMNPEDKDTPMCAIKYQYSPKCRTFLNERAAQILPASAKLGNKFEELGDWG